MENLIHEIFIIGSILAIVSMLLGRFAGKFGLSTLLVTLAVGLIMGNGGRYDFYYNSPEITRLIAEVALAFIIFAGGFETQLKTFKGIKREGVLLATLGVLLTTLFIGVLVHFIFGIAWVPSLLVGAVLSSTDSAAVFSLLGKRKGSNKLVETLQLESGLNDPMAYFLTVVLSTIWTTGDWAVGYMSWFFIKNMVLGALTGILLGAGCRYLIAKMHLKRGLNPVLMLFTVMLLYGLNTQFGGSALLSIYLAGIILGNGNMRNKEFSLNFYDSISWLMETALFLILGLQIKIFLLPEYWWQGLVLFVLIFGLARPLAVFGLYAFVPKTPMKKRVQVSFLGLKGATPIVFALIPLMSLPESEGTKFFHIVGVTVIYALIFQGLIIRFFAPPNTDENEWLSSKKKELPS